MLVVVQRPVMQTGEGQVAVLRDVGADCALASYPPRDDVHGLQRLLRVRQPVPLDEGRYGQQAEVGHVNRRELAIGVVQDVQQEV